MIENKTEEKSKKYFYAIIGQPVHTTQKYLWEKCSKHKKLEDAEMALKSRNDSNYHNFIYKIIPYFDGFWWTDEEIKRQQYVTTNTRLWEFLESKNLSDEARKFLKETK